MARLAHERTRAETCVKALKRFGDQDQIDAGEFNYDEARAEIDAVIAGLVVALAEDEEPASLSDLEARLERGVQGREAFCAEVEPLIPDTSGERGLVGDLVSGALGPLVEAITDIYLDYRDKDRLTRGTIQTQLEATKWPAFASIES